MVARRSFTPFGAQASLLTREVMMVKPTPALHLSSGARPPQKKE